MCVPRAPVAVHVGAGVAVSFIVIASTVRLRVVAASGVSGGHDSSLLRVSPLSFLSELLRLHLIDVLNTSCLACRFFVTVAVSSEFWKETITVVGLLPCLPTR